MLSVSATAPLAAGCGGGEAAGSGFCDDWATMVEGSLSLTEGTASTTEERIAAFGDIQVARQSILDDPPPELEEAAVQYVALQEAFEQGAPIPDFGDANPIHDLTEYAAQNCG